MLSKEKLLSLLSSRFLELIILPTEQCNFRCIYCYEDFSIGKMKSNTVNAIKKFIMNRIESLDIIKISWFGGEPLAAKDIVLEISEFITQLCKQYPKLKYISGMTTNGFTLKEQLLKSLVELGVKSYQISLDGTEEVHNHTRKRMDGASTFKTIWSNLLTARNTDLDFSIMIRVHLTPDNLDDIKQLIEQLKATFNEDKRFSVFFKTIENLGGPNSGSFKVVHGKDKSEILGHFYSQLGESLKAKKINDDGPYVCYASQANSFVIRANGKIGKCTVAFSDDRNNLGELHDDGTISIDPSKLSLWTRGLKSQNANELSCPMWNLPQLQSKIHTIPIVVVKST